MRYRLHFRRNKNTRNIIAENYKDLKTLFTQMSFLPDVEDKRIEIQTKKKGKWNTCCGGLGCNVCKPILNSVEFGEKAEMVFGLLDIKDGLYFSTHEVGERNEV